MDLATAGDRSPPARPGRNGSRSENEHSATAQSLLTRRKACRAHRGALRLAGGLTMLTIGVLVVVMDPHQHGVDFVSGLRRSMSFNGPSLPPQLGDGSFPSAGYAFSCCAEALMPNSRNDPKG